METEAKTLQVWVLVIPRHETQSEIKTIIWHLREELYELEGG